MKEDLNKALSEDAKKIRGAMKEIIENNRIINKELVEQMINSDFGLLEEYNLLTKSILDAAKVLNDVNAQTPKTIKEIEKIQEKKKAIDLNDLVDE